MIFRSSGLAAGNMQSPSALLGISINAYFFLSESSLLESSTANKMDLSLKYGIEMLSIIRGMILERTSSSNNSVQIFAVLC